MTTQEKVDKVFKDVIGHDPEIGTEQLIYNEIPGWDSVGHMALISGLEDEFGCMLDMDDILDMSSYAKALEIMAKHA